MSPCRSSAAVCPPSGQQFIQEALGHGRRERRPASKGKGKAVAATPSPAAKLEASLALSRKTIVKARDAAIRHLDAVLFAEGGASSSSNSTPNVTDNHGSGTDFFFSEWRERPKDAPSWRRRGGGRGRPDRRAAGSAARQRCAEAFSRPTLCPTRAASLLRLPERSRRPTGAPSGAS